MTQPKIYKSFDELPAQMDLVCVSRLTGLSADWIRKLCKSGVIPGYQVGRVWYIDKEDYINWKQEKKASHRKEATSSASIFKAPLF